MLRKQLEHALKETEKPLSVTSSCIYNREGRMGIDRVKDDVETRLYSESDTIRNTQNRLKDALNSVHKHMMNMLIVRGDRIYSDSIRIQIFFIESRMFGFGFDNF